MAPSASQYSLNVSYSNRAKAHGSPASCVAKLKYDFQYNSSGQSRVSFIYISASEEHAAIAQGPIAYAQACEATAGRQSTCHQMKHVMVALPADELSDQGRKRLVIAICDLVRQLFEGQPVLGAVHRPSVGEKNFHLHLSHGLRIIKMRSPTAYELGERIMSEQRPKIRVAARLPATNHHELRALRAQVAELIAKSLAEEFADTHLVERWRCGHLTLVKQVRSAEARGDWQFVQDNVFRDPTKHEGCSGSVLHGSWADNQLRSMRQYSNALPPQAVGSKSLTIEIVELALKVAKRRRIRHFALFRMLALDHDLIVRWTRRKRRNGSRGANAGLSFQLIGGPTYLGRSLDFQLHKVCETLGVSRSDFEVRQDESDLVDNYLMNYQAQEGELRSQFVGRLTAAVILHMIVRKSDLGAPEDHAPRLNQSQEVYSLDTTIDRSDISDLVEELRRPLNAAEHDLRDDMILRDLESNDDLRAYVHRKRAISMYVDPNSAPEGDPFRGGQASPDERTTHNTDQDAAELDWSDRPRRQKVSS